MCYSVLPCNAVTGRRRRAFACVLHQTTCKSDPYLSTRHASHAPPPHTAVPPLSLRRSPPHTLPALSQQPIQGLRLRPAPPLPRRPVHRARFLATAACSAPGFSTWFQHRAVVSHHPSPCARQKQRLSTNSIKVQGGPRTPHTHHASLPTTASLATSAGLGCRLVRVRPPLTNPASPRAGRHASHAHSPGRPALALTLSPLLARAQKPQ
eukprot:scaffold43031_cov60-Phaeocystis_antarctica.AAC.1